jgi:hypothetical protein
MRLITHRTHLDALPASDLKTHIKKRFDQLSQDTDVPPNIVLVEENDDVTGPDYAFVGPRGLLSDLFEEHEPGHPEFARPYEWASQILQPGIFEALVLVNGEDGYWILIPEEIVEANPNLAWVLTDESQGGLSDPQPL